MGARRKMKDLASEGHLYFLRNISIDNVIFSYDNEKLKVLLRFHTAEEWAITGGFIERTQTLDESAIRIANDPTGLDKFFMKQFQAFGGPERRNYHLYLESQRDGGNESVKVYPENSWLNDYFVTIGYYSLMEFNKVEIQNGQEVIFRWWDVYDLPPLMIDHKQIIESALETLRVDIYNSPVAKEFLPQRFTLPELHSLYEVILGKELDRGNFYRRMKSLGWLIKLYEKKKIGQHKSPNYHMFDPDL